MPHTAYDKYWKMEGNKNYKILVTGANGQLGKCIFDVKDKFPAFTFLFTDIEELDITDKKSVFAIFEDFKPDFCINCAAYTAVDKAESEKEICTRINKTGPGNLALACDHFETTLIHISTDYVYHVNGNEIITEESELNPKSHYAVSKLEGENEVVNILQKHIIIRTSWLYSEYGHNFVKTILKLAVEKPQISVVDDQIGSPTYAGDLAMAICEIIKNEPKYGVFNYSNEGFISWYDFAKEIIQHSGCGCRVIPISSDQYSAPAPRPGNSRLSKEKIKLAFQISIPYWKDSLITCLRKI